MGKSMMHSYLLGFVAVVALGLMGCSQGGVGLASDQDISSKCPPNGCAGKDPDRNQLMVEGPGKTALSLPASTNPSIEFSGECYPSTYTLNRLTVVASVIGGGPVSLAPTDVYPIQGSGDNEVRCVNGKYGMVINGAKFPAGQYQFTVKMVGIDQYGNPKENSNSGVFTVNVNRY